MRKRAERTLKELYDLTQRISEPKITPILKGSCRIQGPVDDSSIHLQETHPDEKKISLSKDCTSMKNKAGTCTVCSAPCSLCMHFKSESGFSFSVRTEADSSSVINVDEMPVLKSRRRDELQHAASETSNLFSTTSSSHDSYSENAKMKANLRSTEASDASDDDMPQVLFSGKVDEGQPFKRNPDSHQNNLHNDTQLCQRFPSGIDDRQSELECHGDNILCISGAGDANVVVRDSIVDIEEQGMEYRNMSICSSVVVNKNIIPAIAGDDDQGHEPVECHCISKRSNATVDLSIPHNCCNLDSVNNVSYAKSQLPSHINDELPITFHLSSHSEYANSLVLKGESMVAEGTSNLQPQAEISRCAEVDKFDSLTSFTSPENESRNFPKHVIKDVYPSGSLQIDGLWQDTRSGTDCEKPSDNCSEGHNESALLAAAKGEDKNMQKDVIMDENYELEAALDDVKVCDTCGDAGREDLLAICSRCNDGAEHTYCMQIMLDKVPEGQWLCEECKNKELDNHNVDECETVSEKLKSSGLTDVNQNSASTLIPKQAHKLNTKPAELDAQGSVKGLQGPHFPLKRQVDHLEEGKASELSVVSTETTSPKRKPFLSRQISSKNRDTGNVKAAIMETSSEVQPAKGSDVFSRPKTNLSSSSFKGLAPIYSPRGHFSRSASFSSSNASHNFKTLIENAPSKQRSTRKSATNNLRTDSLFKSSPNTTFKNTTSGFSNTESASKKSSLQQSRIEELRSLTVVKEKSTVEKKNFSAFGNPSVRQSATSTNNYLPKADVKSMQLQSYGKLNSSSETSVRKSNGLDADDFGSNEEKNHALYSSTLTESFNGNNADNSKRSKVNIEGIRRSVSDVNGSHRKFDSMSSHSTVQPLEAGYKGRIRDSTGSRLSILGGDRTCHFQKGNESGRLTHHCSMDKLGSSAHKTSDEQKMREVIKKGNKWREVVVAAMSKSVLKCDELDTPEKLPVCSADTICEAVSKHIPSALNQTPHFVERSNDKISSNGSADVLTSTLASSGPVRQDILSVEASYKANSIRDSPITTELSAKTLTETMIGEPPFLANQLNGLIVPKSHLACPLRVSAVQNPPLFASQLTGTAVPMLESIWQGSFSVSGTGSPPILFFGIQAHISNCASHRVFQIATKAPDNIQLEEVSHINSCPLQLLSSGPQEDNIALFFFAKDIESYDKSYRKLMDKMHRNDLALRGNIGGDELLIFTSNKLPINSQRWNKMHFLWGMFRGKRRYCLSVMDDKESLSSQGFCVPPIADVLNGQNYENSLKQRKLSDTTASKRMPGESINAMDLQTISFHVKGKTGRTPVASSVQHLLNQVPADPRVPQEQSSSPVGSSSGTKAEPLSTTIGTPNLSLQNSTTKSFFEGRNVEKNDGTCQGKIVSKCTDTKAGDLVASIYEIGVESSISSLRKASSAPSVSSNCIKGTNCINIKEENEEKGTLPSNMAAIDDDLKGNVFGTDLVSCESTTNRKRVRSCSMDTILQPSCKQSKGTIETIEKPTSLLLVEDARKQKTTCYPCATTIINDNVSARSSSKVHPMHSSISRHRQPDENIPQNTKSTERCFFPVDLGPVQNTKPANIIDIPSSDDDTPESSSPDLELALGGKSKPTKTFVLPSLFHSVGGKQQRPPEASADGDDASASLSLSLFSFPAPDKERSAT